MYVGYVWLSRNQNLFQIMMEGSSRRIQRKPYTFPTLHGCLELIQTRQAKKWNFPHICSPPDLIIVIITTYCIQILLHSCLALGYNIRKPPFLLVWRWWKKKIERNKLHYNIITWNTYTVFNLAFYQFMSN